MPWVKIKEKGPRPKSLDERWPRFCLARLKLQNYINDNFRKVFLGESSLLDKIQFVLLMTGLFLCAFAHILVILGVIVGLFLIIGWNMGRNVVNFPTELFWWPQSTFLGGSGYPPPSPLNIAQLNQYCPQHRPSFTTNNENSIRTSPRWIIQDSQCLNISQLDAGVCISSPNSGTPTTMKCLPSFLVIGAQKAGSTDLRGLLSFHPFLGNLFFFCLKNMT